jgi:hypothetical protein
LHKSRRAVTWNRPASATIRTSLDYAAEPDATAVTAIIVRHGGGDRARCDRRGYEPQAAWLRMYQTAMTLSGTPSSQAAM